MWVSSCNIRKISTSHTRSFIHTNLLIRAYSFGAFFSIRTAMAAAAAAAVVSTTAAIKHSVKFRMQIAALFVRGSFHSFTHSAPPSLFLAMSLFHSRFLADFFFVSLVSIWLFHLSGLCLIWFKIKKFLCYIVSTAIVSEFLSLWMAVVVVVIVIWCMCAMSPLFTIWNSRRGKKHRLHFTMKWKTGIFPVHSAGHTQTYSNTV